MFRRNGIDSLVHKLMALLLVVLLVPSCEAVTSPLSPNLQVVLLAKILMYEKSYRRNGAVTVYVVNAPKVADAFNKLIGESAGHIAIKSVDKGDSMPNKRYDLVYINDDKYLEAGIKYVEQFRAILVTGRKSMVQKGVTLGTSAEKGRPRFYLNLTASFSADLDWEPKILGIVSTFR